MTLRLEFVRRRRVPWLGLFFLVGTLAWAALLFAESISLHEEAARNVQRIDQLKLELQGRRRAALQLQAKVDPEASRRRKEQEKIIGALRYPWSRVLSTIENADSNDVAVLSLSHEQGSGQTQITLESINTQGLVAFVDALNHDGGQEDVGDVGSRAQWYMTTYQIQPQNNPQTVRAVVLGNQ